MLGITDLSAIDQTLLEVPALIDRIDRRDPGVPAQLKLWLTKIERELASKRMACASHVAAMRGAFISVERGVLPQNTSFDRSVTRQRAVDAAATNTISQVSELVLEAVAGDRARIGEAVRLGRQIVALATGKDRIKAKPKNMKDAKYVEDVWRQLLGDAELKGAAIGLEGLAGPADARIIIARTIQSHGETSTPAAKARTGSDNDLAVHSLAPASNESAEVHQE